jgi:hypothetical protein
MNVFISYAAPDRDLAHFVAKALNERNFTVLHPDETFPPGQNWGTHLAHALEGANAMLVFLSEQAAASENVRNEVSFALGSKQYAERLIPILIGNPRSVPWILRDMHHVRFEGDRQHLVDAITKALSSPIEQRAGAAQ